MFDYEIRWLREWVEKDRYPIDIASFVVAEGDISANLLLKSDRAVLSSLAFLKLFLATYQIDLKTDYKDGDRVNRGIIAQIQGKAYQVLTLERTMLNILTLMSGIATKTKRLLDKMPSGSKTRLAATRKVLPGLGYLQKLAVKDGGGDTHRWNLVDMVMLKDNHLAAFLDIEMGIKKVKNNISFSRKLEVEADDTRTAFLAAKAGADIVMLDNFSSGKAITTAQELKQEFPHLLVEVSGGITEKNYLEYVDDAIDIISMSELTAVPERLDFSLEVIK